MAAVRASPALVSARRHRSPQPLTASAEDCLARIAELMAAKACARVTDIAAALGISSPSVTARVQQLARRGLLRYERYRGLALTGASARRSAWFYSPALAFHVRSEQLADVAISSPMRLPACGGVFTGITIRF